MKKKEFKEDEIKKMIEMYTIDYLGTPTIGKYFNTSKRTINKILREYGIVLGSSGRKWKGGKKESEKRWYNANKEKIKEVRTLWRIKNKDRLRKYHKNWRSNNIVKLQEHKRNYEKNKKLVDPKYKLSCYIRTAIYTSLKEKKINKNKKTFDLLGYSLNDLINNIESKFKKGMSWENYGQWHIDHVLPISSFIINSVDDDEFKRCWSLENLQPLWAEENLSKGSKII